MTRETESIARIEDDHAALLRMTPSPAGPEAERAVINPAAIEGICWFWDPSKDVFGQAASAIWRICAYHPFVDGNKRTALATALRILNAAGLTLPDDDSTYDVVVGAARGELSEEDVAVRLRGIAVPLGPPDA